MCGICGRVTEAEREGDDDLAPVERMRRALAHRGPDGHGRHAGEHVALAATRLAIIDPAGSNQPLVSADGNLILVSNAEIYNYIELREGLAAAGHRFTTDGDCEVILHLYEEHGDGLVDHLRGMFAFALWDVRRKRLLLARDRFGEKPLFVHESARSLVFASELRALIRSGVVPAEVDPDSVNLYFHYQYVPEPGTPLTGVRKLPAAHLMTVETSPWRVRERRYWSLTGSPLRAGGSPESAIEAELSTLAPLIVRSDVPVGVALSGGLDSSVVAALVSRHAKGPVHAFSVGFAGRPGFDERTDAQALAHRLGMEYHDVEMVTKEVVAAFPELVEAGNEPIADMTGFCYHAVARAASANGIRVLFQGQGGDELFWGYPWVRRAMQESWARLGPAGAGAPLTFYDLDPDFREAARVMPGFYGDAVRDRLSARTPQSLFTLPAGSGSLTREQLAIEITRLIADLYLMENGIAQGDRLTMANSVELRLPLVDHRIAEAVIGYRRGEPDDLLAPKHWLRRAARDLLPANVLDRPKKPFSPPLREWHDALVAEYGGLLPGGELVRRQILTPQAARLLARGDFPDGAGSTLTFKALVLEMWCRTIAHGHG